LSEHDADADVTVELLDLAIFHVPEVGGRNVEFGSIPVDNACGRIERSCEGALDRQFDCDDVPYNVNPMEFPVSVRS
jgi:hypothetical protein